MAIETFPIYQGFCGLVTTDRKRYHATFSFYYFLYIRHIICMLVPSFFTHFIYESLSLFWQ